MEQLLQITTVPVAFELKIQNARLEYSTTNAELEISRNDAGDFKIKSRPIKLNMDSFQSGSSAAASGSSAAVHNTSDTPNASALTQALVNSDNPSYSATGQYSDNGNLFINAMLASNTAGLPSGGAPAASRYSSLDNSEFTVRYEMDKMNFDFKSSHGNFEFIPGDIEVIITQRPEVRIEYTGKPLYVPPSVAERFEAQA